MLRGFQSVELALRFFGFREIDSGAESSGEGAARLILPVECSQGEAPVVVAASLQLTALLPVEGDRACLFGDGSLVQSLSEQRVPKGEGCVGVGG